MNNNSFNIQIKVRLHPDSGTLVKAKGTYGGITCFIDAVWPED